MSDTAFINAIKTAVPAHEMHSAFLASLPLIVNSEFTRQRLKKIADRSQIQKRYTILEHLISEDESDPQAFYKPPRFPATAERMSMYKQHALPLAAAAVNPLFNHHSNCTITHLIVTSCTGFYAPGLDIDIVRHFRLPPSVERILIGYMGCYAAVNGLKLARDIIRSQKRANVLMVNIELCSLHFRMDAPFDQLISFAIFGDGCAASLISAEPVGMSLEGFYSTLLPDTMDQMSWDVGDDGFYMVLGRAVPNLLKSALRRERSGLLHGKTVEDFNHWAIHPGGRGILDMVQHELNLSDQAMLPSRRVMRDHGNMSSPTLMFILKEFMKECPVEGLGCAMAFGPGLVLESMIFGTGTKG